MRQNVDLLRAILFSLEAAERSPPEPVFIAVRELAANLSSTPLEIIDHLEFLAQTDLIEGPGLYLEDSYLFRKVTRKGYVLIEAVEDKTAWEKIKSAYLPPPG